MTLLVGILRRSIVGAALLALLASNVAFAQPASASAANSFASPAGFGAMSGRAAAAFRVPSDVKRVRTWRDAKHDLTYTRYQQYVQPQNAAVDGAQLTVVKRGSTVVLVIGGYYPSVRVTNRLVVGGAEAVAVAAADKKLLRNAVAANAKLKHRVELWLNPANGRLFQQVESGTLGLSFVHQVDAETGDIIDSWNATMDAGTGTGVKGDTKDLTGLSTELSPTNFQLKSTDSRVQTHNAGTTGNMDTSPVMSDSDDVWNGNFQKPGVDAQYYTALTDRWYTDNGLFDLVEDCASTASANDWADTNLHAVVHYGKAYNNAFFDDTDGRFGYGDGDGFSFRAFSGGQDVVSHEMTHRVTECRAPLAYTSWSGALNEAISDIMGTAIEWDINEATTSGCKREPGQAACPDWWVGEDIVLDSSWGFRNMADPTVFGDPSHWEDRCIPNQWPCSSDSGGVHINSLIPGHAFYLMAHGGRNARCAGATDTQADCDVDVPAIPVDDAASIMFAAWGLLPNPSPSNSVAFNQQFCHAHDATVHEAELLFPGSTVHAQAAELAWSAVGRGSGDCPGPDDEPPTASVNGVTLASSGSVGTNGSVPLLVTWSATDAQSGVDSSQLQRSPTGADGSWSAAASGTSGGTSQISTTEASNFFRVNVTDGAGNSGTSSVSGPWTIGRMQEDSATYKGIWSAMPDPTSFGTTRFTTKLGAWARFNFTGTEVDVVSTRAIGRGKVKIFVDGVFQRKVNLATGTLGQRQIVYRLGGLSAGSHSIRIQNITGGQRIDVDGIVFLNH